MNRVLGTINISIGIFIIFYSLIYLTALPKMIDMYNSFDIETPINPNLYYLLPLLILIYGVFHILVGLCNVGMVLKSKYKVMYKVGVTLLIVTILTTVITVIGLLFASTSPLLLIVSMVKTS